MGKMYYKLLYKIFNFDEWHVSVIGQRPYAMWVVKYINRFIRENTEYKGKKVVEIGCGLGDIVSRVEINNRNKLGIDISPNVIKAARCAHPLVQFEVGSFERIRELSISFLICVNFMFELEYEELEENFKSIVVNNSVDFIILDKVSAPPYKFEHNYDILMQKIGYHQVKKSRGYEAAYGSRRHIVVYKKYQRINGVNEEM